MKHGSKFKLNMSILRGLIVLAVFAVAIIPNTLFAQAATTTPAICNMIFEGYIYSSQDKTCTVSQVSGCQNPFEYTTKDMCEKDNDLKTQSIEVPTRPGTILDRARADRQSFVRSRLYDEETSNQNVPNVEELSNQILEANKQVLLLEINQSITKTHDEIVYLENIISRLEQRLVEIDNDNTNSIDDFIKNAQIKINSASSTLGLTQASSTSILTADPLGPTLSSLKRDILETVTELKEARNLIRQAIIEVKKII